LIPRRRWRELGRSLPGRCPGYPAGRAATIRDAETIGDLARRHGHVSAAAAIRAGEEDVLSRLAEGVLRICPLNLIERPWGGLRIREHRRLHPLPGQREACGLGLGEAFEVSAWPDDPEAAAHPSRVLLDDGSGIPLPELLGLAAGTLLGPAWCAAYGPTIPLLPKTLDIAELLSVQGHPEGNIEAYVILDADPGATLRLGWRHDVDEDALRRDLLEGRRRQEELLRLLERSIDPVALQRALAPHLARRDEPVEAGLARIGPFRGGADAAGPLRRRLRSLKDLYWRVLDLMNPVPVRPGQVFLNANPARLVPEGRLPFAEVHALGNPEGREVVLLEIRRPGVTFRAWDNVRFPIREIDVDLALRSLSLRATRPEEYLREPLAIPDRPGAAVAVRTHAFTVELLAPTATRHVEVPADGGPHTLHVVRGEARLLDGEAELATLGAGRTAVVPASRTGYRVVASEDEAEVLRVLVPLPDAAAGSG
jgi:hypothetical protein